MTRYCERVLEPHCFATAEIKGSHLLFLIILHTEIEPIQRNMAESLTPPLPQKIKLLIGILGVSTVGLLAATIALGVQTTPQVQVCGAVCVHSSKS